MSMEVSELGPHFMVIILPGVAFLAGFRVAYGVPSKSTQLGGLCLAVVFGLFGLKLVEFLHGADKVASYMADPLNSGLALAIGAFLAGFIIGGFCGWVRMKLS